LIIFSGTAPQREDCAPNASLDKSGDAGNQAATEANLKKFDTALKNLEEHTK